MRTALRRVAVFFSAHPAQQFRRNKRFYLAYDTTYAAVSTALLAFMFASGFRPLFRAPTLAWIAFFPLAAYAVVVAHLCTHNAVHGNFPRAVNRPVGEVLGFFLVVRFASWVMVHLRHHRFSDDRRLDPHPNFASFWTTAKHTVVHVEKQLMQEYYDIWGDTPDHRAAEALRAKVSYGTNILVLAVWMRFFGPWFFFCVFLPASILGGLFIIHFNWTTHNGARGNDFRPVNLNRGYFWLGNKLFAGIYMHANHHKRPHLFNPRTWDVQKFGPEEPRADAGTDG